MKEENILKNEYDYLNYHQVDFSKYKKYEITKKEIEDMKNTIKPDKKVSFKRWSTLVACAAIMVVGSQTAFGKEMIENVTKVISTGYNSFYKLDEENVKEVFENIIETENIKVTVEENDYDNPLDRYKEGEDYDVIEDLSELDAFVESMNFDVMFPEKLPDGFEFLGAARYEGSGDYIDIFYEDVKTGEYIFLQERIANNLTAFGAGTSGSIEEVDVKGNKAVIMDDDGIFWEDNGVSFSLIGRKTVNKNELLKIAESFK